MTEERRGLFIVLEGIDGTGKSTQVQRLADHLRAQGREVVASKEPTDGRWGKQLRESAATGRLPLDEELAMFIADRKEHIAELIQPALDAGKVVVLDRYYYSTIAYQGARGASTEQIRTDMRAFAPEPDLVLLLDLEPNQALERIEQNRGEMPNEFEQLQSLQKIRAIFRDLAVGDERIQTVNASQSVEDLTADIQQRVATFF